MLDRYSLVPLHGQLRAAIRERIDSGRWPPQSQLPPERDLCGLFQVSRITVRHAISELVAEGHLVRLRGRGTYVAQSPFRKCLLPLGFTEDMRARGQRPGAKVLTFEETAAEARVAEALQLGTGEPVVLLKRVRLANDEPVALETVYLAQHLCPGILEESLENRSLYELLRSRYQIRIVRAQQQWQAVACPAREARLLGIRGGSPVLQIQRITYDAAGRPFEYQEAYFRGDRYVFCGELSERPGVRAVAAAPSEERKRRRPPEESTN